MFGPGPEDWLGLHRHLARWESLTPQGIGQLRSTQFGRGRRSAVVVAPWDIEPPLPWGEAEAEAVTRELEEREYPVLLGRDPLLGRGASAERFLETLRSTTPAILHFIGHGVVMAEEELLALWGDERAECALVGATVLDELHLENQSNALCHSPLVVLNCCWAGRARSFGGRREDLAAAFLRNGAETVIAAPVRVHDRISYYFGNLLYSRMLFTTPGIGSHFTFARSVIERICREDDSTWSQWLMLRLHGNPYASFISSET